MGKLTGVLYENSEAGKQTLVFVYYAGHGQMIDNFTRIVLNDEHGKCYPLEKMLRSASQMNKTIILGLFDCCRELPPTTPSEKTRGIA